MRVPHEAVVEVLIVLLPSARVGIRMRKAAEDKFAAAAALEKQVAADPLENFCKDAPVSEGLIVLSVLTIE